MSDKSVSIAYETK